MPLSKPRLPILQRGHPLARGLIGAWLAYEGAGDTAHDLGQQGIDGALQGNVSWTRGDLKLTGFDTAGDGVDITGIESSSGTYTFVIVLDARTTSETFDYAFDFDTGRLVIAYQASTSGKIGYYDGAWHGVADTPLDGEKHALAWVLDGDAGVGSIYDNGVLLGTDTYTSTNLGGVATLGTSRTFDSTGVLKTDIYTAQVYDRALSVSEIRQLYVDPYAAFRIQPSFFSVLQVAAAGQPRQLRNMTVPHTRQWQSGGFLG